MSNYTTGNAKAGKVNAPVTATTGTTGKPSKAPFKWIRHDLASVQVLDHPSDPNAVLVSLLGTQGEGNYMTLDREVWKDRIEPLKVAWGVNKVKGGRSYVVSGSVRIAHLSTQHGRHAPTVVLARLIAGAKGQEWVRYANGDTFDLRSSNLRIADQEERRSLIGKWAGESYFTFV